jgi:hypothetical protein
MARGRSHALRTAGNWLPRSTSTRPTPELARSSRLNELMVAGAEWRIRTDRRLVARESKSDDHGKAGLLVPTG